VHPSCVNEKKFAASVDMKIRNNEFDIFPKSKRKRLS